MYVAGRITGLVYEDALRMFAEAASEIERCGHTPVNPMKENGLDGDGKPHEWVEYMERDIPLLLSCDGIYLLPNWKESNGARIEKVIAEHSKMLIVTSGFAGRRGDVFQVCIHCGIVLTEDDAPDDGLSTCLNCCHKLTQMSNHEKHEIHEKRAANYCGRCGRKLNPKERYLMVDECFRCHNGPKAKPEEWIECQADGCTAKFIQTDPETFIDLCPPCEAAVMRAGAAA
jgi:hypothetical protein